MDASQQELAREIKRRRSFAIISHPDAGKTTLTEKLLLFGGALREAGAVRAQKASRYATSDWLELEKQRGISVSSSVMHFDHAGYRVNILDTPGHKDFSEDTYRTLIAADSAVMLIDAGKGVEVQTRKLFEVCRISGIPIFTFINKMDRLGRDPLELLTEIEAGRWLAYRLAPDCFSLIEPPGPDQRNHLHREKEPKKGVVGTQPNRAVRAFDCAIPLAGIGQPRSQPQMGMRKVRVQGNGRLELGNRRIEFAPQIKNSTQSEMRVGVALVGGDGRASGLVCLDKRRRPVVRIPVHEGEIERVGEARLGGREVRGLRDGPFEQALRLGVVVMAETIEVPKATLITLPDIQIVRGQPLRALALVPPMVLKDAAAT